MEVQHKVLVVTGAGSGIGRALCHTLADKGALVAAWDVNEMAAKETVAALAGSTNHRHGAVDVGDREAVLADLWSIKNDDLGWRRRLRSLKQMLQG
jgi:NAD(P)-dependent dehydrogenase (short-subunit alcohol dehydrogenase family)